MENELNWAENYLKSNGETRDFGKIFKLKLEELFPREKTINYIIKYVTKVDEDHKNYKSIILTSKGIGSNYIRTHAATQNRYKEENTNVS